VELSTKIDSRHGVRAIAQFEPNVPWNEPLLRYRSACYAETSHPLAARARFGAACQITCGNYAGRGGPVGPGGTPSRAQGTCPTRI